MKRLLCSLLAVASLAFTVQALAEKPDLLEIIEISGEINDGSARAIAQQVEAINETPKVKSVLLVVDTPGGGVLPSAVIYEELSKLKVPVVGWCNNECASGGVYILTAPSVKFIGVRSQTIGGSVGVVANITRYNRLLDWARIDNETFKSGLLKDSANPTRDMTPADRVYLQGIISSLAERFYEIVSKGRPSTAQHMDEIKSARIFIGKDIVRVGLADAVMTRAEAIAKAKALSGSKSIFTREELKKMSSAADERPGSTVYAAPVIKPQAGSLGDVPWLIEMAKEIRSGESVRFEYRLTFRF